MNKERKIDFSQSFKEKIQINSRSVDVGAFGKLIMIRLDPLDFSCTSLLILTAVSIRRTLPSSLVETNNLQQENINKS